MERKEIVLKVYNCKDCKKLDFIKSGQHFKTHGTSYVSFVCDSCYNKQKISLCDEIQNAIKKLEDLNNYNINVLLQTPAVPVEKPKKTKKKK